MVAQVTSLDTNSLSHYGSNYVIQQYLDSLGLDSNGLKHVDPFTHFFASVLQSIVGLVFLAAWVVVIYYSIKKIRNRKKTGTGAVPLNTVYRAWQGHNLGTTSMEPGDLTRIERELRSTGETSEESDS